MDFDLAAKMRQFEDKNPTQHRKKKRHRLETGQMPILRDHGRQDKARFRVTFNLESSETVIKD